MTFTLGHLHGIGCLVQAGLGQATKAPHVIQITWSMGTAIELVAGRTCSTASDCAGAANKLPAASAEVRHLLAEQMQTHCGLPCERPLLPGALQKTAFPWESVAEVG